MGIHWHVAGKVEYIATDADRQTIPWVRAVDPLTGEAQVYTSQPGGSAVSPPGEVRTMDCVDCHNRPTHIYLPPDRSVDDSLAANRIDPSLPYVKQQSVQVLTAEYKTTPDAMQAITTAIPAFYREKYPQVAGTKQTQIKAAVADLQRIFRTTIFPEMKVDWRTHPNNVGHFYFQGCFRCHDGNHVSKDGRTISKDCDSCHTMLAQQEGVKSLVASTAGVPFKHPVDLGDLTAVNCSDCHSGGVGP